MHVKRTGGSLSLSENEMDSEDDDLELSRPLTLPSTTSKLSTQQLSKAETNSSAEEDEFDSGAGGDGIEPHIKPHKN